MFCASASGSWRRRTNLCAAANGQRDRAWLGQEKVNRRCFSYPRFNRPRSVRRARRSCAERRHARHPGPKCLQITVVARPRNHSFSPINTDQNTLAEGPRVYYVWFSHLGASLPCSNRLRCSCSAPASSVRTAGGNSGTARSSSASRPRLSTRGSEILERLLHSLTRGYSFRNDVGRANGSSVIYRSFLVRWR